MKKSLIAIIATVIMLLSFLAPLLTVQATEVNSDYTASYGVLSSDTYAFYPFATTSLNVGFSKYGELIGINATANTSIQSQWIGLQYDGRDPFAPASIVPMTSWINGWYMDISYINPSLSTVGYADRQLFAFAMFGDGNAYGGPWQTVPYPETGVGGRQTNGMVITSPLEILYDGPREFVAQANNAIYDEQLLSTGKVVTWPVLNLTITLDFDKVMKQVILYKDVKLTIPKVDLFGKVDVQLSNREEYDLGPAPSVTSYATYYPMCGSTVYTGNVEPSSTWESINGGPTVYTGTWTDASELYRDHDELQSIGNPQTVFHVAASLTLDPDFLKVYVGGVFVDPSVTPTPYTVAYNSAGYGATVTFKASPYYGPSSIIQFDYKYDWASAQSYEGMALNYANGGTGTPLVPIADWNNKYDYAQIISSDGKYIAWDGIWPPASSYTVDGLLNYLYPMFDTQITKMSQAGDFAPKESPTIIADWDFALDHTLQPMYRCVEVKGVSDRHNGDDSDASGANGNGKASWSGSGTSPPGTHINLLDTEAKYQLDSVFNPYDLSDAVETNLNTWVQYHTVTAADYASYLATGSFSFVLAHSPVHFAVPDPLSTSPQSSSGWEDYNTNAERVTVDGVLLYPLRQMFTVGHFPEYELSVNPMGIGTITITVGIPAGLTIKVVYSTDVCNPVPETGYSGPSQTTSTTTPAELEWTGTSSITSAVDTWVDRLHVNNVVYTNPLDTTFTPNGTAPTTNMSWYIPAQTALYWSNSAFIVYKEDTDTLDVGSNTPITLDATSSNSTAGSTDLRAAPSITVNNLLMEWLINYLPENAANFQQWLDVHIYDWNFEVTYSFTVTYNTVTTTYTITPTITFTPIRGTTLFMEKVPGRYNLGVVGTNAATVDSAGLSMVTAAFKDKEVEYGIGAGDTVNPVLANVMPNVMSKISSTSTYLWSDYYYESPTPVSATANFRTALSDDWCTTWQITRANLIGSGGPLANMLMYYDNDFESAFYGLYDTSTGRTFASSTSTWTNPWQNAIAPLTDWATGPNRIGYTDTATIGYAVVTTYQDLNGTNIFGIWGNWGRDTYYAEQYFWQDLIQEFQSTHRIEVSGAYAAPLDGSEVGHYITVPQFGGATGIVLQIIYSPVTNKPVAYSVINVLGTISETTIWGTVGGVWSPVKGGLSDP
jgi:hypothetical protein